MYGVGYWNSYTTPLYLINDRNLYTLQLRIKSIVLDSNAVESLNLVTTGTSTQALKMTTIIVAALPVLCISLLTEVFCKRDDDRFDQGIKRLLMKMNSEKEKGRYL